MNLLRSFSGEINAARQTKNEKQNIEKPKPVIGDKVRFKTDIEALEEKYGKPLLPEISMTLTEALELMPRDRKRTDAYKSLQKYLDERGVKLIINSNKTKNNGSESKTNK